MPTQDLQNLLTFLAILVALFGGAIWKWIYRKNIEKRIKAIFADNLKHLRKDLIRIRDERNKDAKSDEDKIFFSTTSLSEIDGYLFLFKDLLLSHIHNIDTSLYPKTIWFFIHYRINIRIIENRFNLDKDDNFKKGWLKLKTVNKLIHYLDEAIKEISF